MLIEILFYGRGGQGGVTAANILVAAAVKEGLHGQGFPFFGAERRGAPVKAFARISDKPIRRHGMFNDADVLVVLHPGLVKTGYTKTIGVNDKGIIIVNTHDKSLIKEENFKLHGSAKAYIVDATRIATRNNLVVAGWPVVNTSMLGSLAKALGIISIDNMAAAVEEYFGGKIGELNAKAVREAYNETVYVGEIGSKRWRLW
ncbi:2-oxoacid:acceptor oxidoreductase family protein [Desulfurococcaceae archaeon MEX13E-LK6-19]|nr:2-oxoacid:acceptor oxidoreductase family protein [Desulfurococcaceae archaeon MEX13E-LK6-19]